MAGIYHNTTIITFGNFLFRYRNALFPVLLLMGIVVIPPGNDGLGILGFLLSIVGLAWRGTVIGYANIKHGGVDKRVHAPSLITNGIFGACRNPLYVGNMAVVIGVFIVYGSPFAIAYGYFVFVFCYMCIVAAEEAYLHTRFGSLYEDYCRRVNRWLPDARSLRLSIAGMRFNWRRVIAKDYSAWGTWLTAVVAVLGCKALHDDGAAALDTEVPRLLALLALIGLATLAARHLKKSGRLDEERSGAGSL